MLDFGFARFFNATKKREKYIFIAFLPMTEMEL